MNQIVNLPKRLTVAQLAALYAAMPETGMHSVPRDLLLMGKTPAVGAVNVNPRYVGAVAVQPQYPGRGRVGSPAQMVQAAPMAAVDYSPQAYTAGDTTWFPLGAHTIVAGGAPPLNTRVNVTVRPQRPIVPQQMYCPSNVQNLLLHAVTIGGTNIFASEEGLPIELLSEVSNVPEIEWPTIDPSVGVTFTVSNLLGTAQFFKGGIYGTQVRN